MSEPYTAPEGQIVTWYGKLHYAWNGTSTDESRRSLCNTAWGDRTSPNRYVTADSVVKRGFCKSCVKAMAKQSEPSTARYYVQGDELWMIAAPGAADGGDSPVLSEPIGRITAAHLERDTTLYRDVVAALRTAGLCELQDRVVEG